MDNTKQPNTNEVSKEKKDGTDRLENETIHHSNDKKPQTYNPGTDNHNVEQKK